MRSTDDGKRVFSRSCRYPVNLALRSNAMLLEKYKRVMYMLIEYYLETEGHSKIAEAGTCLFNGFIAASPSPSNKKFNSNENSDFVYRA